MQNIEIGTVIDALEKLVFAADDFRSSDPEMPSHGGTVKAFEDAMAHAEALLEEIKKS